MLDQTEINMVLIAVGGVVLGVFFGIRAGIRSFRQDAHRLKAILQGAAMTIAWIIAAGYVIFAYGFSG